MMAVLALWARVCVDHSALRLTPVLAFTPPPAGGIPACIRTRTRTRPRAHACSYPAQAVFPQYDSIPASRCESKYQNLKSPDGRPIDTFYYSKGL